MLGVFLVSFSVALLSHAPGGLGVLEIVFLAGLSDMDPASVMAALLVFRLFYLIIPLILAIFVVLGFERSQLARGIGRVRRSLCGLIPGEDVLQGGPRGSASCRAGFRSTI